MIRGKKGGERVAILGEIPRRPGDRSLEALWQYVDAFVEAVRHMGMNIEGDNLGEGVIGAEQLSAALREELGNTLAQIRAYDASFRRNMQIITNAGSQVSAMNTRVTQNAGDIAALQTAGQAMNGEIGRNAAAIREVEQAMSEIKQELEQTNQNVATMEERIIAALEALDTAVQEILDAMRPEPEPDPEPEPETGGEEENGNGGEGE